MSRSVSPPPSPVVRAPEPFLREGLAGVYRLGFRLSVGLLTLGVVLPLAGWEASAVLARVGVVLLLATPVAAVLQVGRLAQAERDRALRGVVAGIVGLLALAVLISWRL